MVGVVPVVASPGLARPRQSSSADKAERAVSPATQTRGSSTPTSATNSTRFDGASNGPTTGSGVRGRAGRVLRWAADVLNLRNLDRGEMGEALAPFGVSSQLVQRVFARVHGLGAGGVPPGAVRGLAHATSAALESACEWPELEIIERRRAADGFVKYLFRTADGHAIEAVRIPLPDPADARALRERRRRR